MAPVLYGGCRLFEGIHDFRLQGHIELPHYLGGILAAVVLDRRPVAAGGFPSACSAPGHRSTRSFSQSGFAKPGPASTRNQNGQTAVMAARARVTEILDREGLHSISIAADNSPDVVTISGDLESLDGAETAFQSRAIATHRLRTLQGYHSELLDEILPQFEEMAANVTFRQPRFPLISNLTGSLLESAPDAAYWRRHLREPVFFRQGIQTLIELGLGLFLECGPGDSLTKLAHRCSPNCAAVFSATGVRQEAVSLLRAAGRIYTLGASLSWPSLYRDAPPSAECDLPGHPFYPKHYLFSDGIPDTAGSGPDEAELNPSETALPAAYDVQWVSSEIPPRSAANVAVDADHVWILLGGGPADEIALRLGRDKRSVFRISIGVELRQRYRKTVDRASGVTCFLVPQGCPAETYGAIFQEIASRLMRADAGRWNVVCLGALQARPTAKTSVASLERDQDAHATGDLLSIVQGLIRIVILKRLWIVTMNAQHVPPGTGSFAESPLNVAQSPIWGFAHTVFLEHPDMRGALIDLPAGQLPAEQAGHILDTISAQDGEPLVAFRGGCRHVPRLTKASVPAELPLNLRKDATYVITGGLGGLGLRSAL